MSEDVHEYRVCPRCDRELPLTEEWWYLSVIDSLLEYDIAPFPRWCKECHCEHDRKRWANDPEYRKQHTKYVRERSQDPVIRQAKNLRNLRYYHRKAGNADRVVELEAELKALKEKGAT